MFCRPLPLLGVLLSAAVATAADMPSAAEFDRQVIETLKAVHNDGADLYNTGNPEGCLRVYQGALTAVGPLLNHHPELQKRIRDGLAEAGKLEGARTQAFKLHELIETTRADLKEEIRIASTPPPMPPEPEPKKPEPKKPEPEPKKPEPEPKKPAPKKPEVAPMPKPVDPKPPTPQPKTPDPKTSAGEGGNVSGNLTLLGQPVKAAEITFVTLNAGKPKVFHAQVEDGKYATSGPMPAGDYAIMVTGGAEAKIPAKYETVQTSDLRVTVTNGDNSLDLDLTGR